MEINDILNALKEYQTDEAKETYKIVDAISLTKMSSLIIYNDEDIFSPIVIDWIKEHTNNVISVITPKSSFIKKGKYLVKLICWKDHYHEIAVFITNETKKIVRVERTSN